MDVAVLWAAVIGVGGTLVGSLGTLAISSHPDSSERQRDRDHDHRERLQDERISVYRRYNLSADECHRAYSDLEVHWRLRDRWFERLTSPTIEQAQFAATRFRDEDERYRAGVSRAVGALRSFDHVLTDIKMVSSAAVVRSATAIRPALDALWKMQREIGNTPGLPTWPKVFEAEQELNRVRLDLEQSIRDEIGADTPHG